ncbi:KOW domain-containing RNA-binding protein [Desulfovirgula thermocuniculi]|uniref:KOW domain-containing RNA-binding protein n=1 Tax=Desulfovirgula thermocuniculi TaxID=348842 RepID=UPI000420FB35|nr:KOW domain-containing RNA-binding protein [Desulfovirgula thermocuniculi]
MPDYFHPGRLVSSTAGRDRGKFYLILQRVSETRVHLVNGAERKVGAPKLKNIKHLKVYPLVAREIAEKVASGQRVTDLEVRRALQELLARYEDGGQSCSGKAPCEGDPARQDCPPVAGDLAPEEHRAKETPAQKNCSSKEESVPGG